MSSNASVNITSLEDTKEVAKLTALDRDSENETSSGSDAFDSKCRSGNFAALGKTNNNTEEEPGFRNERDDILQCVRQNFVDTSTPVALPHNNHVENIEEDADEGVMDIKSPSNLDNNLNQKEDFITDRQALKPENSPEAATCAVEKIEIDQDELCPLAENKEINEAELTDSKVSILTFDRSERNEEKIEIDQDDEELDSTSGGETSQDKILTDCIDRTEEDIEIDQEDDNTSGAADATY
ncbi:uncharacterized protein LOC112559254, partial [Pomacea canaliculata]|uniref:uncharacterized protein LOC112559254 n=1 Tax=Pomacea canaliculata TaxID=400727 RepID=UPI000D727BC8